MDVKHMGVCGWTLTLWGVFGMDLMGVSGRTLTLRGSLGWTWTLWGGPWIDSDPIGVFGIGLDSMGVCGRTLILWGVPMGSLG